MLYANLLMLGCLTACVRNLEMTKKQKNMLQGIMLHNPGTGLDDLIGNSHL